VNTRGKRIDYLSQTCPGKTHDKKIADEEGIFYPPAATLYKDTGFQGYEPAVKKTWWCLTGVARPDGITTLSESIYGSSTQPPSPASAGGSPFAGCPGAMSAPASRSCSCT